MEKSVNKSIVEQIEACRTQLIATGAPFELIEESINNQSVRMFRNAFSTLIEFINSARQHGDETFMVYRGESWSFNHFFQQADAVAAQFQSWGVQPGQRVAIAMRNRPEWAVSFVATVLAGAVPSPLNSFGLGQELQASLNDLEPVVLCCDTERLKRIDGDPKVSECRLLLVGENSPVAANVEMAIYSEVVTGSEQPEAVDISTDDPALILFTSGASSRAKGVLSSNRSICQALFAIDYIGAISAMLSPQSIASIMERGLPPTTLTVVPLFHVSGLHAQLLTALRHGRRLVIMYKWDATEAINLIRAEKVTQFNGAPSMVAQLLKAPGFEDKEVSDSLSALGFGGAGLSQKLIKDVLEKRPNSMCGIGFGLTETNGIGAAGSGQIFSYKSKSCGLLSPLLDVRIVNDKGESLASGEQGEIWLRGVTLMMGYWRNEAATEAAMHDSWFCTGDVGYIDDEGFLFIVDRIKDVINRAGEKIASAEIESCLSGMQSLSDIAVFSLPSEQTCESVAAAVVVQEGTTVNTDEIQDFVAEHLASYKVPEHVFIRSKALPRNPAGKVLKHVLQKEYQ